VRVYSGYIVLLVHLGSFRYDIAILPDALNFQNLHNKTEVKQRFSYGLGYLEIPCSILRCGMWDVCQVWQRNSQHSRFPRQDDRRRVLVAAFSSNSMFSAGFKPIDLNSKAFQYLGISDV